MFCGSFENGPVSLLRFSFWCFITPPFQAPMSVVSLLPVLMSVASQLSALMLVISQLLAHAQKIYKLSAPKVETQTK